MQVVLRDVSQSGNQSRDLVLYNNPGKLNRLQLPYCAQNCRNEHPKQPKNCNNKVPKCLHAAPGCLKRQQQQHQAILTLLHCMQRSGVSACVSTRVLLLFTLQHSLSYCLAADGPPHQQHLFCCLAGSQTGWCQGHTAAACAHSSRHRLLLLLLLRLGRLAPG
jgi:hypothetical protein